MTNSNIWVGMDVHADKIVVAVYHEREQEAREEWELIPDERGLGRLVKKLRALSGKVRCIYEAGPCGYMLQRFLTRKRIICDVAAPSLIPRKPGDRVKTDRRDARKLGRLYRSGELTTIAVPDMRQEALRDLVRAREDVQEDLVRRRHRLSRFLLRHGHRYRQGQAWTQRHGEWMRKIRFVDAPPQAVLDEYLTGLEEAIQQLQRFNEWIEQAAQEPAYQGVVQRLKALRGVSTLTALTVVSEVGDLRRFLSAPAFMASIGLVPSEYSSGSQQRRGSITKAGNAHLRRVMVEAAWHYRHRPGPSRTLQQRRAGQPAEVIAMAKRAEQRLNLKYRKLVGRGKRPAVAVARELAGFIWAVGQLDQQAVNQKAA